MIFCEDCRAKKNWPKSVIVSTEKCSSCGRSKECYEVPSIKLIPEAEWTTEQKLVYDIMQQAFKEKAESLVITNHEGVVNWRLTTKLREALAVRNGKTDWFDTYNLRLAIQKGVGRAEEIKSHRRVNHV